MIDFKKYGIFVVLIALVFVVAACDTTDPVAEYDVTFVVEDEAEEPLEGAEVTLGDLDPAATDAEGVVEFDDVEEGTYEYTVTLEGYVDAEGDAVVEEDLTVEVTLNLEIKDIIAVADIDDINVDFGTDIEDVDLPETVEATLEDDSTVDVDVDWDTEDYDGNTAGSYVLDGTLVDLPAGVANPDELAAEVTVVVAEDPNLVSNATFEDWEDGEPVGWDRTLFQEADAAEGDGVFQSDDAFIGNSSAKIVSLGDPLVSNIANEPIPVIAGESYYFSAMVKTEDVEGQGAYVRVFYEDEDEETTLLSEDQTFCYDVEYITSDDWTEVSITLEAPEAADSETEKDTEVAYLALGFQGRLANVGSGVAYFDNVKIIHVE